MRPRFVAVVPMLAGVVAFATVAASRPAVAAQIGQEAQQAHEAPPAHEAHEAHVGTDGRRHDEFGVVPDDAEDKDLALPDPVLDRTWPGPKPGEGDEQPLKLAPDEDSTDPFQDKDAPPGPGEDEAQPPAPAPAQPAVAPDGHRDPGSPVAQPNNDQANAVQKNAAPNDPEDPAQIEEDENKPSPLDEEQKAYDKETGDPSEW